MSKRVVKDVVRPEPVSIVVNGVAVSAYQGESLATALLAAGVLSMYRDAKGRRHSLYCNMGVCFECMVVVEPPTTTGELPARVRACLTPVSPGLRITVPES